MGTLIRAFIIITAFVTDCSKLKAIIDIVSFVISGIMIVIQIKGAPILFDVCDFVVVYFLVGFLGYFYSAISIIKNTN